MIYQNNFRYGEISRLTAGRFDTEAYSQGAFEFTNAQTMVAGGFKRRPPLKIEGALFSDKDKKVPLNEIYKLKQFSLSETISYILGFSATEVYLFQYDYISEKVEYLSKNPYPNKPGTDTPITMTKTVASKINTAQYYDRMYVVSHDFYPMVIEVNASSNQFSINTYAFLKNQDGKKLLSSVPSYDDLIKAGADKDAASKFGGKTLYPIYTKDGIRYYIDQERTEEYTLYDNEGMEPISSGSDIENYDVYQDDDLCTIGDENTYPSVVAIINDCLYFAATRNRPQVFWRSRIIGSSQWVEDFSSDSMHDFICYEVVATEETSLVDDDHLPRTPIKVDDVIQYHQENGNPVWYRPLLKFENPKTYYNPDDEWKVYEEKNHWVSSNRVYKQVVQIDETNAETYWYTNPEFTGEQYDTEIYGNPVQQPMIQYDFSDYTAIISSKTRASFVTTDSCALRLELNTGRQDRIIGITSACEKIIVCTTTSEWLMPDSLSAISNLTISPYQNFGSLDVPPVVINGSMIFLQRSNVLREFFLYEGYMNNSDLTSLNREILDGKVVEIVSKNTPTPCIYVVLDNGEMRVLTYDKEIGIQAWSKWKAADGAKIVSLSVIENGSQDILVAIVKRNDGSQILCSFDENEEDIFLDFGDKSYETRLETTYAEIIDNSLAFGRFKRAKSAWVRPYNTGYMYMGNDERQMKKTSYKLGSDDYRFVLLGSSERKFSMKLVSSDGDPMNILALAWEAD